MSADQAARVVRLNGLLKSYQGSGLTPMSGADASSSLKMDLNDALTGYRSAARQAGMIDAGGNSTLQTATQQANSHLSAPTMADGSAYSQIGQLRLPIGHQDAVTDGLGLLNDVAPNQFSGNTVGPFSLLSQKAGPWLTGAAGLGATAAGHPVVGAELGLAALGGGATSAGAQALSKFGGLLDRATGLSMTPAEARLAQAQKVLARNPDTFVPTNNPVEDLRDLTGSLNRQQQTDAAWQQHLAGLADANAVWTKALSQQSKQNASAAADTLSNALWSPAADPSAPNLTAVTNSQVRGSKADQGALAKRDATEQAQQQASQSRGQNQVDQAGNWMERQLIQKAKSASPGVPITGAAALQPGADVFSATGGRFGSPAGLQDPRLLGAVPDPQSAPVSGSPAPPQPQSPAASGPPVSGQMSGSTGPSSSGFLPTGGMALAQMMHGERFPGVALPSPDELHSAIDDLAADGSIAPQLADHLHAGGDAPSRHTAAQIADRVATGNGLPSILDPRMAGLQDAQRQFQQASGEVSSLMGGQGSQAAPQVPNGGPRGPILNQARWQGAANTYQRHATQMMQIAPTTAEKQAISQIAATPAAADKQAVLDVYQANNPGADLSRFTPQLMKGI